MPQSNSEDRAQIAASGQHDKLTCDSLDVSRVEWKGDLVPNNDMEDGCTYTWTPAIQAPAGETGRSITQRLVAFGRRLCASTFSKVCADK